MIKLVSNCILYCLLGESGLGKSTLINSLFLTDLYPERIIPGAAGKINLSFQYNLLYLNIAIEKLNGF